MPEKNTVNFNNIALQNGIITGFICVIYMLILYFINLELVVSFWINLTIFFMLAFKIITANTIRIKQKGYITFKQGLKATFTITAIAVAMWLLFEYFLYSFIDNDLVEIKKKYKIEAFISFSERARFNEKQFEDGFNEISKHDFSPSFYKLMQEYSLFCVIGFIYSLIISGIFYLTTKHNDPELQVLAAPASEEQTTSET